MKHVYQPMFTFFRKDGTFNALYAYYYGLKQTGSLGVYKLQKEKVWMFINTTLQLFWAR